MKISKIKINNFRLLKQFEIDLEDDLSLVIGKNNCGKTSLLSVLEKFIGSKSNANFTYDDFSVDFQKELQEKVENYTTNEIDILFPMGVCMKLFITHEENDDLSNISMVMMDLDPNNKMVVLGFEYAISQDDFNKLKADYNKYKTKRTELDKGNKNKNELAKDYFTNFIKDEYKKYFNISRKSIAYDLNSKEENNKQFIDLDKNKISLSKIIRFKSISARRAVSNAETDSTLSVLSSKYYEKIEEDENEKSAIEKFKDTISDTDRELDSIYDNLFKGIVTKVGKFGGIKAGDSAIKIVSSLTGKELLKGNTTVMYKHSDLCLLPENYNGLGYLNLISMIFEIEVNLSEFRKDGKENEKLADINLFFIEEPEAHTHPQMQYVFIKNIKEILRTGCNGSEGKNILNMQTIITTHSSHITAESDFNDIKYFYKTKDCQVFAKNLKDLEIQYSKGKDEDKGKQQFKFLKQYLTLNRSELFFADKAIFIEGDTERILLPAMMKKIDQMEKDTVENIPMLSQNISIVEVGAYSHIFEQFIEFIGVKSLIITDIDSANLLPEKDKDGEDKKNKHDKVIYNENKCRVSGENGVTTTNASLKFFYAKYIEGELKGIETELQYFVNLPFDKKKLLKNTETNNWEQSEEGNVAIIYQIPEENKDEKVYHARSFEDAFFHLNRQFIIDNKETFSSLKNIKYFEDDTKDTYDLAEKCIGKKPSFAMDILFNSATDKNKNEFSNWEIPEYIKEGLLWLKQN
jgi:putative ATP-dependent endonuclease of OLD family